MIWNTNLRWRSQWGLAMRIAGFGQGSAGADSPSPFPTFGSPRRSLVVLGPISHCQRYCVREDMVSRDD